MEPAVNGPATLAGLIDTLRAWHAFTPGTTVWVARAPGRLDVMGGIADYSGSLVLQRPIAEGTWAAVERLVRPSVEIVSLGRPPCVLPTAMLAPGGTPVAYEDARQMFAAGPHKWAAYMAGILLVLARERDVPLTGVRIVVASQVPEGKGVSSSAAVETATMTAVAAAFRHQIDGRDVALLCQKAENLVAGAPCGVMDQMTCVFGDDRALLALLCQPAELQDPVAVPRDLTFWGIDSGERHAVGGASYGDVRAAAFMGLRILCEHATMDGNHLANIPAERFDRELARHLPEEMCGDEFLARYGATIDPVTSVEPRQRYRVRAASAHPVHERARAERFRDLLLGPAGEARRRQLGELMYESHASYGQCGLGSPGTDRLVTLVRGEGPDAGLYGARITGGGSGGTVAVVGRHDAAPAVARVAAAFERQTGYLPHVFAGSSRGAAAFGHRTITI